MNMFTRLSIEVPSMDTTTPSNTLSATSALNIRLPSMKNHESGGSNDSTFYSSGDSCQSTPTESVTSPLHKVAIRIELNSKYHTKPISQGLPMSITPLTPTTHAEYTFGDTEPVSHSNQNSDDTINSNEENVDTNLRATDNVNTAITVTVHKPNNTNTNNNNNNSQNKTDHLLLGSTNPSTNSSSNVNDSSLNSRSCSSQRPSSSDLESTSSVSANISDRSSHNGSSDDSKSTENGSNSMNEMDKDNLEKLLLGQFGYRKKKEIAATLQGYIFVADILDDDRNNDHRHDENNDDKEGTSVMKQCVIKKTSKKLHSEHITIQNGKKFGIYENILKECIILKHLTENRSGLIMTSFTKYVNFIDDSENYYLVMEHGGSDLFDFIIRAHELIAKKTLKIKEWRKFSKYLFWQMIVVLKWLHSDLRCCHLDISLENILIKNGNFIFNEQTQLYEVDPNVQIKFCDFGLAELFPEENENFSCVKYCGKTNYKAPEVYAKLKPFDARKADIWSTGVVLFCMMVGSPPYNKPHANDQAFLYIKTGKIDQLLFQWGRNHFITVKVLSLLHKMLKHDESKRFLIDDVIQHPWLSLYYHKYKYQMQKKSRLQQQKNQRNKGKVKLPLYRLPGSN